MPGIKIGILLLLTLAGIVTVCFLKPISQDVNFHHFSDDRIVFSIPNFYNVISNIPFIIIGCLGMMHILKRQGDSLRQNIFVFFLGVFLTGFGSAYYHLYPTSDSLIWDRLPMTISFMAFFSIIIGEFISNEWGKRLLIPLVCIGLLSIVYWMYTAKAGQDDLRFYALVQFLPIILIPLILLLFNGRKKIKIFVWLILGTYLFAKLFEAADYFVFELGGLISGHSIKHLAASIGPLIFLIFLRRR